MTKISSLILLLFIFSCKKNEWSAEKQNTEDNAIIVKYLKTHSYINGTSMRVADNNTTTRLYANATKDKHGIYYYHIQKGNGISPTKYDKVKIHYKGFYPSHYVFDGGSDSEGYPSIFSLDRMIEGWKIALPKIKAGYKNKDLEYSNTGKALIFIPSQKAYGKRGSQSIAPNAVLIFEIELLEVIKQ